MRLPHTLEGLVPLTFHCRDFRSFTLSFKKERDAVDVFESVRGLTVTCESSFCDACHAVVHEPFSNRYTVVCVLLHAKSSFRKVERMVPVCTEGRVYEDGIRYTNEGVEVYGYK